MFSLTSGVRTATPASRPRAARTSSIVGASSLRMPLPSERDRASGSRVPRLRVDVVRRRQVLDGDAERLEERDLLAVTPPRQLPEEQIPELADDVRVVHEPLLLREDEVSGLGE